MRSERVSWRAELECVDANMKSEAYIFDLLNVDIDMLHP